MATEKNTLTRTFIFVPSSLACLTSGTTPETNLAKIDICHFISAGNESGPFHRNKLGGSSPW